MVERGGIRVDWFEERGGGREAEEKGMEMEVRRRGGEEWGRNGGENEEEEEGRRKRRRGMMMMRGKKEDEDEEENAEDGMLELRLSLAVAIKVPSPHREQSAAGSFVVHQHQHHNHHLHHNQNSHHHRQQQQLSTTVVERHQSPMNQLLQRPSSPLENLNMGSSRASLAASLKHIVSQQQPPMKVKPMMSGGVATTARHPLQYGDSPFARPQGIAAPLVRASSSSHTLQEGQEVGVQHFQGIGSSRIASSTQVAASQPSSALLGLGGQRPQSGHLNPTHQSMFSKGFPQQSQSRPAVHRNYSRSSSPGLLQQSAQEPAQQGQPGLPGQGTVPSTAFSRIFATTPYATHIASQALTLPVSGPQLQAFLQHQASNAVSVASHRQAVHPTSQSGVSVVGKNPSAFSVVRPAVSGTIPTSILDIPPRDRGSDNHVLVNVCDRKVKLTSEDDGTSLYALLRRWVRNDVPRRDQSVLWDCPPLPRPLSAEEAGTNKSEAEENNRKEEIVSLNKEKELGPIESLTEKDLLQHHVEHFKGIRKRFRDDRMKRIARFMPRLGLLLPVNAEINRRDTL